MYKPPKTRNAKIPPLNRPSQYKSPGGGAYTWKLPSNTNENKEKWVISYQE